MRKTLVFGKKIKNTYTINKNTTVMKDNNGNEKEVFIKKPELIKTSEVGEDIYLLDFEGEPVYNSHDLIRGWSCGKMLNIEDEEVTVVKRVFRADCNEIHLFTDKVVEEIDVDLDIREHEYNSVLWEFNKAMIESNPQMKAYCHLHNLWCEGTDCIELFKLLFPDQQYEIVDGTMRVQKQDITTAPSGCASASW